MAPSAGLTLVVAILGLVLGGCRQGSQEDEGSRPAPLGPSVPSESTRASHDRALREMPFADARDFELAERGFLGTRADPLIRTADGRVAWDLDAFDFLEGEAPDTVNPSLWRQSQLLARHGLFEVTGRIHQVRGFDLANVSFVRGETGWIVIDPLTSEETARAAYDLVTEKLGALPVTAILYTHSHGDHFGGAGGILPFAVEDVPIIAPDGFLKEAISENVIAGPVMRRRAEFHVGDPLEKSAAGTVSSGLGVALARGTHGLVPPTRVVTETGEELVVDGVRMVFQITSGTEAPAEFNVGFPDLEAVNISENANPTQHNILTPRGARVRDAKAWAEGLTEAIDLFGGAEVLFVSHGWPRFGRDAIRDYLSKQRDAYAYLHDQTVRMMKRGMTADEIAAEIELPDALAKEWYLRPYYGSLGFNARAVYEYYLGFFDGNPAHLAPMPPEAAGRRYVEAMGGADRVLSMARSAFDEGDYDWAVELLNRLVFATPTNDAARDLLARAYDQLGWQAENALWRNFYLTGSKELREGPSEPPTDVASQARGILPVLPTADLFDVIATQLDAEDAEGQTLRIAVVFPDRGEEVEISVENSVLVHRPRLSGAPLDAKLTVDRSAFLAALLTGDSMAMKLLTGEASLEGSPLALVRFASLLDRPVPSFPIVTP